MDFTKAITFACLIALFTVLSQVARPGFSFISPQCARPAEVPESQKQQQQHLHSDVAICVSGRDENLYIREWMEHHLNLGVGRIYVFDHNSAEPMYPLFSDLIDKDLVKYRHFSAYYNRMVVPDGTWYADQPDLLEWMFEAGGSRQLYSFKTCLEDYGHLHKWMGFIDVDEFVVLRGEYANMKLPEYLDRYKDHAGMSMQWRVFGTSGHKTRPKNGVLASYTSCQPTYSNESRTTKNFVQPKYVSPYGLWVHEIEPNQGAPAMVRDDYTEIHETYKGYFHWHGDTIALHHYMLKSWEEAKKKIDDHATRSIADDSRISDRNMDWVNSEEKQATEYCGEGLTYVDRWSKLDTNSLGYTPQFKWKLPKSRRRKAENKNE